MKSLLKKVIIIVSDLEHGCPIWVGSEGRKEIDFDKFFSSMGETKCKKIRLAVMDMWIFL